MPALLLRQALLEGLHQLVEAAQRLDLRLLLVGEQLLGELGQPVGRDLGREALVDLLEALEHVAEHPIELVEVLLVLHQRRARQVVEAVHVQPDHVPVHGLHQQQVLAQGHGHLGGAQFGEQLQEHQRACSQDVTCARSFGAS